MYRRKDTKETQYIRDIEQIMKAGTGPFTRKQLAEGLHQVYPDLSYQELMLIVSNAIQEGKAINRFCFVRGGCWDLVSRES